MSIPVDGTSIKCGPFFPIEHLSLESGCLNAFKRSSLALETQSGRIGHLFGAILYLREANFDLWGRGLYRVI
jgi:hypothetical protein